MLNHYFRNCRGNIAVLSALMMTGAAGMAGLVAEYGNGLFSRIEDQRYADVAAMAGAANYGISNSVSVMNGTVSRSATLNGLSSSAAVASLVTSPSGDGNQAVKVIVSTSVPLMLSRMLRPNSTLSVQAVAYAEIKPSSTDCILALDATAAKAISVTGNGNVQAPHCDAVSDSNNSDSFDIGGSSQMTTACAIAVGGISGSALVETSCAAPDAHAASTPDPYSSVAAPTSGSGVCRTVPQLPATLPAGYYCNGLSISGSATFSPGVYYVDGNFAIQGNGTVTGTGVTFYVTKKGTTYIAGTSTVTLSAPTSGTYAGILFFGDRTATNSNSNQIVGTSSSTLTGVLYFPTQQLTYSGNSGGPMTCTQLIADMITMTGSTTVSNSCSGTGVKTFYSPGQTYALLVQ
ncbi:MAG TPA: TadG family pilus assembly protein [Rhizomicrobium sp.]